MEIFSNVSAITKIQAVILAVVVLVALGIGGGYYAMLSLSPSAARADTLTVAVHDEPRTLDPQYAKGVGWGGAVVREIFDTLVYPPEPGTDEYVPALAESWDVSPDGLVYTFHLRKNVKYHSGDQFKAQDVIYNFNRAIKIGTETYYISWVIKSWEAIDDNTVRLTLNFKAAPGVVLGILNSYMLLITNPRFIEEHGGTGEGPVTVNPYLTDHCDGTGPFKVGDFGGQWKKGQELLLERNDYYWDIPPKHVDKISFLVIKETTTQLMMLAGGELDVASIPLSYLPELESTIASQKLDWYLPGKGLAGTRVGYIEMNTRDLPFSDMNARKAMLYVFDWQAFSTTVLRNYSHQPRNVVDYTLPYMPAEDDIPLATFDPEKAKEYFEAASPEAKALLKQTWEIIGQESDQVNAGAAVIMKDCLDKYLNISVRVSILDRLTYSDRMHGMDVYMSAGGSMTPMSFDPWSSIYWKLHNSSLPPSGWSIGSFDQNYVNATTNELIEQIISETNTTRRKELIKQICMIEYELSSKIYTYASPAVDAEWNTMRGYVKGYRYHPLTWHSRQWNTVYKEV